MTLTWHNVNLRNLENLVVILPILFTWDANHRHGQVCYKKSLCCRLFGCYSYCPTVDRKTVWIINQGLMVFNTTFNNISVLCWRPVLLVEKTRVPRENHWPGASHWQCKLLKRENISQYLIWPSMYFILYSLEICNGHHHTT